MQTRGSLKNILRDFRDDKNTGRYNKDTQDQRETNINDNLNYIKLK